MSTSISLALTMWPSRPQMQKEAANLNDDEKKGWDWDKYVVLHKEQHAIMESLTDYSYCRMDNSNKVCHFLQGIKSIELEASISVVQTQ